MSRSEFAFGDDQLVDRQYGLVGRDMGRRGLGRRFKEEMKVTKPFGQHARRNIVAETVLGLVDGVVYCEPSVHIFLGPLPCMLPFPVRENTFLWLG
jgi:hypothetical protein